MNNKKRLVFTISKCRTQNFDMFYCISNNQNRKAIWIKKPDYLPSTRRPWTQAKNECIKKVREFLISIKAIQQDFENIGVAFNKEDYFVLAAPKEKKDWLDYKMSLSQEEIDFFFETFIKLRTKELDNDEVSWGKVTSA